ncbi:MAG: methyl-accepting chemotaxis protein [Oligoflexia bacterium]|nr:methyl-accepting chemotaxis protein [Oligoflexia bacterium]
MIQLSNMKVSRKLLIIIVCSLMGIAGLGALSLVLISNQLQAEKALKTKHLVEVAYSILESNYNQMLTKKLSEEEAKAAAITMIKALRYDGKEYFWINDQGPKMIMHPFKPELDGSDLSDFKDPEGKKLFVEMVDTVKANGAGHVYYLWPKPGMSRPVSKVSYVKEFAPWGWIIGSGIYLDDVQRMFWQEATKLAITSLLIALVVFLISNLVVSNIVRPLNKAVGFLERVAKGDLSQDVDSKMVSRQDEIGDLLKALATMTVSLRSMSKDIAVGIQTLASSSTALSTISVQIADATRKTSEKTSVVATSAEEMAATSTAVAAGVEQATGNISSIATATEEMATTIKEVAMRSEQACAITNQAELQAQKTSLSISQLSRSAQDIGQVVETITTISSQTNLLALNATIEAARTGAAGKGFAVVANEIKELAQQTAAATESIKLKIEGIQNSTAETVSDINSISGVIKEMNGIITAIAAAIEEQSIVTRDISKNIAEVSEGVRDANERVAEGLVASKDITREIAAVNQATVEMASSTEQVKSNASHLEQLAEKLKQMVERFTL